MCFLVRIIKDNANRSGVKTPLSSIFIILTNMAGIIKDETQDVFITIIASFQN